MLFYVVGPSGAGKDSLLSYARDRVQDERLLFAHRYITRPASSGNENHVALTQSEFDLRDTYGLFSMKWESHGLKYGVGVEIDGWMESGVSVVVNGSREYLPVAARRYTNLVVIQVTAKTDVLESRLLARGRETMDQIRQRLDRSISVSIPSRLRSYVVDNSAALEEGGETLLGLFKIYQS